MASAALVSVSHANIVDVGDFILSDPFPTVPLECGDPEEHSSSWAWIMNTSTDWAAMKTVSPVAYGALATAVRRLMRRKRAHPTTNDELNERIMAAIRDCCSAVFQLWLRAHQKHPSEEMSIDINNAQSSDEELYVVRDLHLRQAIVTIANFAARTVCSYSSF